MCRLMRYANIFQSEYSLIFALYLEKKSVLMERHHTVSKRYFFNNIRNDLHELRSKGSRREFENLKPCHATRGNSSQPLRGEVSGKKGSLFAVSINFRPRKSVKKRNCGDTDDTFSRGSSSFRCFVLAVGDH